MIRLGVAAAAQQTQNSESCHCAAVASIKLEFGWFCCAGLCFQLACPQVDLWSTLLSKASYLQVDCPCCAPYCGHPPNRHGTSHWHGRSHPRNITELTITPSAVAPSSDSLAAAASLLPVPTRDCSNLQLDRGLKMCHIDDLCHPSHTVLALCQARHSVTQILQTVLSPGNNACPAD